MALPQFSGTQSDNQISSQPLHNQSYGFPGNAMQSTYYGNSAPFYQPQQYQQSFPQQQMNQFHYPGFYQPPGYYQGVPFANQPVAATTGPCLPDSSCQSSHVSAPSKGSENTSVEQSEGDDEPESECDLDESAEIDAVKNYIQQKTYPQDSSKAAKNAIRGCAKQFRVVKNTLYYVQSSKVTGEPNLRQVVTSKEQQKKIIQQCHVVNGVDGHFGISKTLSAVQGRFCWKGMVDDVTSYVKVCDPCQRENPQLMKTPATLHPIPVTASFWHQVGVDLVGPLPMSKNGYKYILTCCCYFIKWSEAIPLKDKSASSVASALFKLQSEKGAASVFIHDQGTEFINCVNNELCHLMDTRKRIATITQ